MESATSRIFFQPFAFEPAVPAAQTAPPHTHTICSPNTGVQPEPCITPTLGQAPTSGSPCALQPDHPGMQPQFSQAWGSTRAGAVSQASGTPVLGTGLGREDTTSGCLGRKHHGLACIGITRAPFQTRVTLGQTLPFPEPVSPSGRGPHV